MRVFTNQQHIKRNRRLAQVLFFVSLVFLVGGLLITNLAPKADTLLISIPCIIMPIALLTTWTSVRMTNQYVRQPHPEDAIQAALKGIRQDSVLYNYLFKPHHVLVSTDGVFTFVTRYQTGPLKIEGNVITDYRARGPFGKLLTFMRQEQIGKPFDEAAAAVQVIQPLVDEAAPGVKVQPVIAFTSPSVRIEINNPTIPVVLTRKDKEPSLKRLRADTRKKYGALTPEQVATIEKRLNAMLSIEGAGNETTETVED